MTSTQVDTIWLAASAVGLAPAAVAAWSWCRGERLWGRTAFATSPLLILPVGWIWTQVQPGHFHTWPLLFLAMSVPAILPIWLLSLLCTLSLIRQR